MSSTATPAYRLTADCIWNSFRSSGKHHLILTGGRGAGKTALLSQLLPEQLPGLITWAERGKAVYLKEINSDMIVQVGRFDPSLPGAENRMVSCPEGFRNLGVPALERCMKEKSEWITIDEIGYLESACPEYQSALLKLLECKRLAAVVRKQELPFLQELLRREDIFVADLDDPFGEIGCIIMASGMGRRFGGNKLMAEFRGEPLICCILEATQDIFRRRVVVTRHKEVAELCKNRGVEAVYHDLPYRSDTIRLGLERMDGMARCMFCAADQPLLRQETVQMLALSGVNGSDDIWRISYDGEQGNPVIFPAWTFEQLNRLPAGSGGSAVIKKHPQRLRTVSIGDGYELKDVDSPEDLKELMER